MTGETENCEKNNKEQFIVQSVGNAWVICNSKSRPGHKYYFNSLTGESVWNLSPEEIEKAKKYTKALPKSEIERCPEPPLDPVMDSERNTLSQAHINQNSNRQFPNQIPNMFPINFFNGVHRVPSVSGLNPNIWNTAPNNTPIPPGLYYYQPPINYDIQNSQENLQNLHIQDSKYPHIQQYTPWLNKQNVFNGSDVTINSRHNDRHKQWNGKNPDLRQKLIRKRSKSQSCASSTHEDYIYRDTGVQNRHRDTNTSINTQEETPSKYDLSSLKQLKSPNSKSDNWFIVVDTEIILNNFPFLNKVTDPDQNCYLMVPHHVVLDLQHLAFKGNDVSARRIHRFLSQQIDSELAFKGEDLSEVAYGDINKTFRTCVDLAKHNNVILLSNNIVYCKYKNNDDNVNILTINELRMILEDGGVKRVPRGKGSPTLDIKIVVPNENNFTNLATNEQSLSRRFRSKTPDYDAPSCENAIKKKEVSVQSDTLSISSKRTIDTGVQVANEESNVEEYMPMRSKIHKSVEFERGTAESFFRNQINKDNEIYESASSQKVTLHTEPIKNKPVNNQFETIRSFFKRQVDTRSQKSASENNVIENNCIPFGVQSSKNNLDNHTTNTLTQPELVDFKRSSEDSYFNSNPKNKKITASQGFSSQYALPHSPPLNNQKENIRSDTDPSLSKRKVDTSSNKNVTQGNKLDSINHTPSSAKTPEPAKKKCESENLEDLHFCKNPKTLNFHRSTSNQKPNIGENTPNTKYRWRRQRGHTSSRSVTLSRLATTSDSVVGDISKPHKATNLENSNFVNPEKGPSQVEIKSRDPSLDRSSVSSQAKITTGRPSILIEETSTSGIISNTTNDSESMNSVCNAKTKKILRVRDPVMFEVAGQCMEDVLRTRREEWLLRFVQIMEEVLREKLRDSSPLQSKDYAAPGATDLPELARCIIKKYSDYFNVVDAANKLSYTLYRVSDEKGNMNPNIEPDQYMEMYSFGVYLIETLKVNIRQADITHNCEDLQSADESLKKLLYDIQNANQDACHNDTYGDELHESVLDLPEPMCTEETLPHYPELKTTNNNIEDDHKISYSLRSHKTKLTKMLNETQRKIATIVEKLPTNVENTFFASLQLEKRNIDDVTSNYQQKLDCQKSPKSAEFMITKLAVASSPKISEVIKTPPTQLQSPKFSEIVKTPPANASSPKFSEIVKSPQNVASSPKISKVVKTPPNGASSPKLSKVMKTPPNVPQPPKSPSKLPASPKNTKSTDSIFKQFEVQATPSQETFSEDINTKVKNANVNENAIDVAVNKDISTAVVQPVIVRNFTSIAQFEQKLINHNPNDEYEDYDEENYDGYEYPLDYDEYNEETEETNIAEGDEYACDTEEYNIGENKKYEDLEEGEIPDDNSEIKNALHSIEINNVPQKNKNDRFRLVVSKFVEDIRETLKAALELCTQYVEDVRTSPECKPEINMNLKKAHASILAISNSLNSILDRESKRQTNNMILLLKRADLADFIPDEDLRLEYTELINRCRDEVHASYKFITLIMKAAGTQAVV